MTATTIDIPTPLELIQELPSHFHQEAFIQETRSAIINILNGQDDRIILIVGPCSIHDYDSTLEYASKLKKLIARVGDKFLIIMRTYFEKPRTTHGWKGFLYDPDLDGSYDMLKGLKLARKILLELNYLKVPCGAELLEINTAHYLSDLLSWGCIGARTSTSQPHRQLSSSLDFPIGFKNTTDGNVMNAINGILSASIPHYFLGMGSSGTFGKIETNGNPHTHIVLRGSEFGPNYSPESVEKVKQLCQKFCINQNLFIDCSHGNSNKTLEMQIPVFKSVMNQIREGSKHIVGIMLESHLHEGAQMIREELQYGVSITDPCLGWSATENLILQGREMLQG